VNPGALAKDPSKELAKARLAAARAAVVEAGLAGQVQIGVPVTPENPRTRFHSEPATEEGVSTSLDSLLGLYGRSERGRLIELVGRPGSGRTALAYRFLLGALARGELAGWVDLPDALDSPSLRRAGVRLESLLWVRPREPLAALRAAELLLRTGFGLVALDLDGAPRVRLVRLGTALTRLLRAARESRATAVLLASEPVAGSLASLALYTERRRARFEHGLFEGVEARVRTLRSRGRPAGAEHVFAPGFTTGPTVYGAAEPRLRLRSPAAHCAPRSARLASPENGLGPPGAAEPRDSW
jgi:hypothetical protein